VDHSRRQPALLVQAPGCCAGPSGEIVAVPGHADVDERLSHTTQNDRHGLRA
jgi:hypothetical protein